MQTVTVYHYSDTKFDRFDISMCDGFWFTDIEPSHTEMIQEIGAKGLNFCAKCELTFENEFVNGDNYDVENFLDKNESDCIVNMYDGFTDYALSDNSKIKIIEWIELDENI